MSRYLEFILIDPSALTVLDAEMQVAAAAAMSENKDIRDADKIGFATVDNDVRGVNGMNFVRQQVASRTLVDGQVGLCAFRYNETADAIKPSTAARSLQTFSKADPEGVDQATGADAEATEEADPIPF